MEHLSISTPIGLRRVRTSIVDLIKSKGINITTEFKQFYLEKFENTLLSEINILVHI
mgnify:CR=1 FL=1